jgi:plastocyanin
MKSHLRPFVFVLACAFSVFVAHASLAKTVNVTVSGMGSYGELLSFFPAGVTISPGDTVEWDWAAGGHSTTSGPAGTSSGLWDSKVLPNGATFSHIFPNVGSFPYHCSVHGVCCNMVGTVSVVAPSPTPVPTVTILGNISTRLNVETGDNVMIGGFIVTGTQPKKVIVRAIGPSLANAVPPVAGASADPTLELHDSNGVLLASNNDWQTGPDAQTITADGLAPTNPKESALLATLPASTTGIAYTAIVSGVNGTTGVALVEVYDLDTTVDSKLANISTRGFVQTADNVMIGGFIVLGPNPQNVIVRAIGPSLANAVPPVAGALADPTLELHDSNGVMLASNNDWQTGPDAQTITADGLAPTNPKESALLATLPSSVTGIAYTAIVSGVNGTTGVALVEVYALQ